MQALYTLIRLLEEQSDHSLNCLPVERISLPYSPVELFQTRYCGTCYNKKQKKRFKWSNIYTFNGVQKHLIHNFDKFGLNDTQADGCYEKPKRDKNNTEEAINK